MDRPPPLNLIRFGHEWIATNGELTVEGSVRFPEDDPAEEMFAGNGTPPVSTPPSTPATPPSGS